MNKLILVLPVLAACATTPNNQAQTSPTSNQSKTTTLKILPAPNDPLPVGMKLVKPTPGFQAMISRSQTFAHHSRNESSCNRKDKNPLNYSFLATDTNRDNKISHTEFSCKSIHWFGELDKDKNKHVHLKNEIHSDHHRKFEKLVNPETGHMNIVEFMSLMDEVFKSADRDHNGSLSKAEYTLFVQFSELRVKR